MRIRAFSFILASLIAGLGFPGHASLISGELFANYYHPAYGDRYNWPNQAGETVWARLTPEKIGDFKTYFSGSFMLINASDFPGFESERYVGKLDEAYVEYSKSGFQLSAGKKAILWGRADTLNPTGYHTGVDQTILNSESHLTRMAGTGIHMKVRPKYEQVICRTRVKRKCSLWEEVEKESPWSVEAVATPIFAETKPVYGFIPLPKTVSIERRERPKTSVDNSEFALKAGYSGQGWDFSASGFRGFNHNPMLFETKRTITGSTATVQVTPKFAKISAFGADVSIQNQGYVITAETAITWTEISKENQDVVPLSSYQAVIGVERELVENFRAIVQGIVFHFPQYKDPNTIADPVTREIAKYNAVVMRASRATQFGNSLHLLYDNPDSKYRADIFGLIYYSPDDGYAQPKFTYKWREDFHISAGTLFFWGPKDTPLGSVREMSSYFGEIKYFF